MNLTPQLWAEYQGLWTTMLVTPGKVAAADYEVARMVASRQRYESVAARTGVPWFFIAIIHELEGNGSFRTHLHNGDPLSARTVHVPKGRPVSGRPPFTWEESAEDALRYEGLTQWSDWSAPGILFRLELYNGWGYRKQGVRSPYLWSFSNHYASGKYVRDGVYDPKAVSAQVGAAVLLRRLVDRGQVTIIGGTSRVADLGEAVRDVPVVDAGGLARGEGSELGTGHGGPDRGPADRDRVRVAVPAAAGPAAAPSPAGGAQVNIAPILLTIAEKLVTDKAKRRGEVPPKDPIADLIAGSGAAKVPNVDEVQTAQILELRQAVVALAHQLSEAQARIEKLEADRGDPS